MRGHDDSGDYDYALEVKHKNTVAAALVVTVVAIMLLDVYITTSPYMTWQEFLRALFAPDRVSTVKMLIVREIQLPTAVMGVFVGAAFGLAGAVMQTMLNNPLASPYTLGISAGAGVGASIAMAFGISGLAFIGVYTVPAMAFAFALLACGGIYLVARVKSFRADVLILAGIGLVFFFQAVQSLLQYMVDSDTLQNIVFWTMGSLERANWESTPIVMVLFAVVCIYVYSKAWVLTTMRLGDNRARALGIDVDNVRKMMFVVISLLTACCVAFVGSIGFVGIVAPHIARIFVGEDQRHLLIMSALLGSIFLVLADIGSKMITIGVVYPIGIITALIGVPFFFYLLIKKRSAVVR